MWSVAIRCLCEETTTTVPTTRQWQRSTTTKQIHDLFSTKAPGHSFVVLAAFDIAPHTILDSEFVIRDSGFSGRHSGRGLSKLPSPRVLSADEPCKWANACNLLPFRPRNRMPTHIRVLTRKLTNRRHEVRMGDVRGNKCGTWKARKLSMNLNY